MIQILVQDVEVMMIALTLGIIIVALQPLNVLINHVLMIMTVFLINLIWNIVIITFVDTVVRIVIVRRIKYA